MTTRVAIYARVYVISHARSPWYGGLHGLFGTARYRPVCNWIAADIRRIYKDWILAQRRDVIQDEAPCDSSKRESRRVVRLRLNPQEVYKTSLLNYDSAKLSLVRALGFAEESIKEYFKGR